jgi:hypothetical protein
VAVVAGSSRWCAFHNPQGRLKPQRGTHGGQVASTATREGEHKGGREEGRMSTAEREGGDPQGGEEGEDAGQCVGCHTRHLNEPVRKARRGSASTTTSQ